MSHVRVRHRDHAVRRRLPGDRHTTLVVGLDVLLDDHVKNLHRLAKALGQVDCTKASAKQPSVLDQLLEQSLARGVVAPSDLRLSPPAIVRAPEGRHLDLGLGGFCQHTANRPVDQHVRALTCGRAGDREGVHQILFVPEKAPLRRRLKGLA